MIPPPDFAPSSAFSGFEHSDGSSILVAELPTTVEPLFAQFTDDRFASQGIRVTSREDVTIDGRRGLLVTGTQTTGGITVDKLVLLTGSRDVTAVVTGNVLPEPAGLTPRVREAFLTIGIDVGSVDPTTGLSFELTPVAPLRFAGAFLNAASYNESGKLPQADQGEASFIAAPSLDRRPIDPTEASARTRFQSMSYRDVEVGPLEPVAIAGLPGFAADVTARHPTRAIDLYIYAVMLFGKDGGYVLMTGECPATRREELRPVFVEMAASYRPRSN